MEWLLVLWLGNNFGGMAMQRFATHSDCEKVATIAAEVGNFNKKGDAVYMHPGQKVKLVYFLVCIKDNVRFRIRGPVFFLVFEFNFKLLTREARTWLSKLASYM